MRIAVISDVHAAAGPLRAALAAARDTGFDQLLILGDLLTYGAEPEETLDLVQDAVERDGALLVRGNHDSIYLDRESGCPGYELTIPAWIRESVDWTCERLQGRNLGGFTWRDEWSGDGLLAAHANPNGPGDWSYLRTSEDLVAAGAALAARGLSAGLFGHTHRYRLHADGRRTVLTVGSVGQPRDAARTSEWTLICWTGGRLLAERRPMSVEWGTLVRAVRATDLSDDTKDRICRYYS